MPFGAHETLEVHEMLMEKKSAMELISFYTAQCHDMQLKQTLERQLGSMIQAYDQLVGYTHSYGAGHPQTYLMPKLQPQQIKYGLHDPAQQQVQLQNGLYDPARQQMQMQDQMRGQMQDQMQDQMQRQNGQQDAAQQSMQGQYGQQDAAQQSMQGQYGQHFAFNDEQLATYALLCHKNGARNSMQAALECADPNLRRMLTEGAVSCANQAYELFTMLNAQGVYQVPTMHDHTAKTYLHAYQPVNSSINDEAAAHMGVGNVGNVGNSNYAVPSYNAPSNAH